jgi:hypothetical protein
MTFSAIHTLFGILGYILLICGSTLYALQVNKRTPAVRWTILLLCITASVFPFGTLAAVGYLRGVCGDLSLLTQILLGCTVIHHVAGWKLLCEQDRRFLFTIIGVAGLVLYTTAGRYWHFDAYALGFSGMAIVLVLVPLTLWLWRSRPCAGLVLLVSVGAFNLKVLDSTNVWDYLIDPWVTIYAWGNIVVGLSTTYLKRVSRLATE